MSARNLQKLAVTSLPRHCTRDGRYHFAGKLTPEDIDVLVGQIQAAHEGTRAGVEVGNQTSPPEPKEG
jgi:hypothetical protein